MNRLTSAIIGAIIAMIALYSLRSWLCCTPSKPEIECRVDTVVIREYIRDTVIITETHQISRIDTVMVYLPGDTVKVAVTLPFELKTFQTENYRATVSGYKPMLESIDLFVPTKIITQTHHTTTVMPPTWEGGIVVTAQVAPGWNNQFVGARVRYNKGRFSIEGTVGYNPFDDVRTERCAEGLIFGGNEAEDAEKASKTEYRRIRRSAKGNMQVLQIPVGRREYAPYLPQDGHGDAYKHRKDLHIP